MRVNMKKTNNYITAIIIVAIHLFFGFAIVYLSVGFDLSKVNLLQVCYALVVGSPLLLSLFVYFAFKRLIKNITSRGLIVFLKVIVFVLAVLLMLLLNYVFEYFLNSKIITENIGSLLILLFIGYGTLFIEFKDGKICVF
ncbi:MAG: hypothetical protein EA361_02175 [Bacteroidetes bacterium]|nr:MAG: hypothetical protein EA361_02175 [Bacteroidota bacterium]